METTQTERRRRGAKSSSAHRRGKHANNDMRGALEVASLLSQVKTGCAKRPDRLPVACVGESPKPLPPNATAPLFDRTPIYNHPLPGAKACAITLTGAAVSWNGLLFSLCNSITSGASDSLRTGDVIRVIGYKLRYTMHIGTAASPGADCQYQVQVIESPLPGLGIATMYADVGTAYSALSPPDWDWSRAMRRTHEVFNNLNTYKPSAVHHADILTNHLVTYEENTGTPAVGQIYVACISNENPSNATENPQFAGEIMLLYQDV